MDVKVLNEKRKVVFEKEKYLGEEGISHDEAIIPYVYALWQADENDDPGEYIFTIKLYDLETGYKTIYKPTFSIVQ